MLCEMCGKESDGLTRVTIEGSKLSVCSDCSRFGTALPGVPGGTVASGGAAVAGGRSAGSSTTVQERLGSSQRRMSERDLYTERPEREVDPAWSR